MKEALTAAFVAMELAAKKSNFFLPWQDMNISQIGYGVMESMTMVRFYLLALKGAGYLNLRLDNLDEGIAMLEKVLELDKEDRLGAGLLLSTVSDYKRRKDANFGKLTIVG